ncbi:hypothetical protein ACFQVC_30950 [Streptomyces monticola]|uniref:Transcriptional regulator n=1 Tax=Streptomyces monticola TaxID=2666263 RepID=A0ABW2JSI8_9ACTN
MGARRTPNGLLRARLEEAQWSGAELARAVNAAGRQAGLSVTYDRSNVSHWLAGTRPRHPARDLLVRVFAKRLGRLVSAEELGLVPAGAGAGAGSAEAAGGAARRGPGGYSGYADGAAEYGACVARQVVYGDPGPAAAYDLPGQHGFGTEYVPEMSRTEGRGRAGGGARRELAELIREHRDPRQLRRLRELAYRAPGVPPPPPGTGTGGAGAAGPSAAMPSERERERGRERSGLPGVPGPRPARGTPESVLPAALRVLELNGGRAARELIVGELPGTGRNEAARLCRMLGRAWADDLGHGAAQRALELSCALAGEAGDPVLRAMALRDMSVLALELGRTAECLALAEAAVDGGFDRAGAGTRAFLLTQRGVARAVAGDGSGAVKDMDGAEYWIDRGDDDENGPYSLGALLYQRARMHRAEGDLRRSVSALELSLSLRLPVEQRSRALIRIELAHQRLGTGDYAAAGEELRMLVPCHESLRSARVDAALAYLRNRALAPEPAPLPRIAYRGRC